MAHTEPGQETEESIQLHDIPRCSFRRGTVDPVTLKPYVACGYRPVSLDECIECGGYRGR